MKVGAVMSLVCAAVFAAFCAEVYLGLQRPVKENDFASYVYNLQVFAVIVYGIGAALFFWVARTLWFLPSRR